MKSFQTSSPNNLQVPLTSVGQGKALSRDKEVIGFIDKLTGRVIDYWSEIEQMKLRGPGLARNGGAAKMRDLWNYFKVPSNSIVC